MRQLADELRAETGEERRISGDEDDPVTGNPVEEAAAEVEGDRKPGTRRNMKTRQRTRTRMRRRKKIRVTATQGTTTTTIHHRRPRTDRSPGLPPKSSRFLDPSGKPTGTNPGLGVAPGNGPGGGR